MTATVDALILERDDENFLYRIMMEHRTSILGVVQRFKTLDPMYDHEDLEQEAFFGVRTAALYWEDARAINMKFNTYLNWHISRHFQGKFKGEDKIVDILDQNNRVLVTIPYRKYRKTRRAIAQDKGYSTRIRSLLVYYDDPVGDAEETKDASTMGGAALHLEGDRVVDVYNANDELIITLPLRAYTRMSRIIKAHGYRAHTYSIYDPPVRAETKRIAPPARAPLAENADVIDVYNRRRQIWMRLTPAQYETAREHIEFLGGLVKFHTLAHYPEQPAYEELLGREHVSAAARTYEHVA